MKALSGKKTKDLTHGPIAKPLFWFSLPLFAGRTLARTLPQQSAPALLLLSSLSVFSSACPSASAL